MKKKVLLVDDSVTIHRVIDLSIDADNYDVIKVFSGEDAKLKLNDGGYDFILLDNKLEGTNITDFTALLKASQANAKIILLVGAFDRFGTDDLKKIGADDYLVKPFDSQSLNAKLTAVSDNKPIETPNNTEPPASDNTAADEDIMKTDFIERMPEADINRETDSFADVVPAPLTGQAAESSPDDDDMFGGLEVGTAEVPEEAMPVVPDEMPSIPEIVAETPAQPVVAESSSDDDDMFSGLEVGTAEAPEEAIPVVPDEPPVIPDIEQIEDATPVQPVVAETAESSSDDEDMFGGLEVGTAEAPEEVMPAVEPPVIPEIEAETPAQAEEPEIKEIEVDDDAFDSFDGMVEDEEAVAEEETAEKVEDALSGALFGEPEEITAAPEDKAESVPPIVSAPTDETPIAEEIPETAADDAPVITQRDESAPKKVATFPEEKASLGGLTINISREEIVAILGSAIDKRLLEETIKDVLARNIEEIVRNIVPAMAEKYIKAEIERLKNDE